jgi:hypothetical protein
MKRLPGSLGLIAALLVAAALPAEAQERKCTCRALGKNFELGDIVCLSTPKGYRLATCGMAVNNTAWHFSDTPCVSSNRTPFSLAARGLADAMRLAQADE